MPSSGDEQKAVTALSGRNFSKPSQFQAIISQATSTSPASPTSPSQVPLTSPTLDHTISAKAPPTAHPLTPPTHKAPSPEITPTTSTSIRSATPRPITPTSSRATAQGASRSIPPPTPTPINFVPLLPTETVHWSAPPASSKSTTTKPAALDDIPIISAPSEPASSEPSSDESVSLDDDESILQTTEDQPPASLVKKIFAFLRSLGKLAKPKENSRSKARVTSALNLIQSLSKGETESHKRLKNKQLVKTTLTGLEYKQLLLRVDRDQSLRGYFNDKFRYDYTHKDNEFVIRMPKEIHEYVGEKIGVRIGSQLERFQEGAFSKKTAELAKSIKPRGSAEIKFPTRFNEDSDTKSPDKSYKHKECKYPGLVIEIAWSQEQKPLSMLADRYFQKSEGGIQTVIGVNLEYNPKIGRPGRKVKPATFWIWHMDSSKEGLIKAGLPKTEEFRDENKKPIDGIVLQLPLTDFVCRKIALLFPDVKDEIRITSRELCEALADGEEEMRDRLEQSTARQGSRRSKRLQELKAPNNA
ncbi:uncharacterized protein PAC_15198 [Phialocephala subalpina]|uniref:Uncharacterized protein n=1 Tax=Phialocephala subalpina TaxID=576137 RepID=A0A1L7XJV8_9HELO|nr:uncharacterized protein PAC_15198 [Phialocephala subalpina]